MHKEVDIFLRKAQRFLPGLLLSSPAQKGSGLLFHGLRPSEVAGTAGACLRFPSRFSARSASVNPEAERWL